MTTIQSMCSLTTYNNWNVHYIGNKKILVEWGFSWEIICNSTSWLCSKRKRNKVFKLFKGLYGLKKALHACYEKIHAYLTTFGFQNNPIESTLDVKCENNVLMIIVLFVDDVLFTGPNEKQISYVKVGLNASFEMSNLGILHHCLGTEFRQANRGIALY